MKLLLWIQNSECNLFQKSTISLKDMYGEVNIESFMADERITSCIIAGKELKYLNRQDVKNEDFDLILVMGDKLDKKKVLNECHEYGIDESKIIYDYDVVMPYFSVEKSNKMHRSKISIFSINDFGKKIYQKFQLPYLSPFIDSVMPIDDWLKFLENPQQYISEELCYDRKFMHARSIEFPCFRLGGTDGLRVYMLCEKDIDTIQKEWSERVKLINWYDLLVMMYTDSPDTLDRFDRLPYAKKVCFTSFESRLDSAFYLPKKLNEDGDRLQIYESIDKLLDSNQPYYDLWDMVLYGKRTIRLA